MCDAVVKRLIRRRFYGKNRSGKSFLEKIRTMPVNEPSPIEQRTFAEGTIIFRDGDAGDCAYVVESGSVEISKDADGRKVVLGAVMEAGMFGEMALIDKTPRMATATAVEPTVCYIISKDEFQQNLREAAPFVILLVHMLIRNVRSVSDQYVKYVSQTDKTLHKSG